MHTHYLVALSLEIISYTTQIDTTDHPQQRMACGICWSKIPGSVIGKPRPRAAGLVWEGSIGRDEVFGEEH